MKYLERYKNLCLSTALNLEQECLSELVVVIPAYKEEFKEINETLASLDKSAKNFGQQPHVLILINYKLRDDESIKVSSKDLYSKLDNLQFENIKPIYFIKELPDKKGGVGMARKILMDSVFLNHYKFNRNGLIVNLDADTLVSDNYFLEITQFFRNNEKLNCGSIHFEHHFNRNEEAIVNYELHLRYFVNMQRLIELPFAYQTVGSAMAVRSFSYAKEGGMPLRQAGEDFYFVHKYSKVNQLGDITEAYVLPSDRVSDRVPFGTGKAVGDFNLKSNSFTTYDYRLFEMLKDFLKDVLAYYKNGKSEFLAGLNINETFADFLEQIAFNQHVNQLRNNANSYDVFAKNFFIWFDAFKLMKYLHFMRDNGYPNIAVDSALIYLFDKLNLNKDPDLKRNLITLRLFDKQNKYSINGGQI